MLYIFDKNEQLVAILANEADACPYSGAVHTEKLNQENTFTFSIPADRQEAAFVKEGAYVAFRDADLYWQMFEIQKVTAIHNNTGTVQQVYAEHVFYELLSDIIKDARPYHTTAQAALMSALANTRWQPGIVYDFGTNSTNFYYENVLSALQNIINTWGGELRFRIEITDNIITSRYVDILNRRGEDTGKSFEYSKDMAEIQRETDITGVYTAAYGRGKGEEIEAEEGTSYGRRLTFADVVWTTPENPVDKPVGQEWVGDPDALAQWGRNGRHRFGIYLDSDETDPEALLQKTWDFVQKHKNPRITYSLNVLDLEQLSGYNHEAVRLGDTVYVRDADLNIDVAARVIEIGRDLCLPENTKIILGNFRPSITDDAIIQAKINRIVSDRQGVWDKAAVFGANGKLSTEWLEGIIDTLQNQVNAGAGTVTLTDDNGILIVDNPKNPTAALRLLGGVFAIANTKNPDGTWNWRTFGDGSGFTAEEINAGVIRTALVKIFGDTHFYWDDVGIRAINPANSNQWIQFNKDGLMFTKDDGETFDFSITWQGLYIGKISKEDLAEALQSEIDAKADKDYAEQLASGAEQNAKNYVDENAVKQDTLYSNVLINSEVGVKATHSETGEYTQLSGAGLKRFVPIPVYQEIPTGVPNFEGFENGEVPEGWNDYEFGRVINSDGKSGNYCYELPPSISSSEYSIELYRLIETTQYITKDCQMSFWYKSLISNIFLIDGVAYSLPASDDWTEYIIDVAKGYHVFMWRAGFSSSAEYALRIDDITFEANPVNYVAVDYTSEGYDYGYRTYIGEAATLGQRAGTYNEMYVSDIWIQLPDDFKGKNFEVFLSFKSIDSTSDLYTALQKITLEVLEIDYEKAAFKVRARLRGTMAWYDIYWVLDNWYHIGGHYYSVAGFNFVYMAMY